MTMHYYFSIYNTNFNYLVLTWCRMLLRKPFHVYQKLNSLSGSNLYKMLLSVFHKFCQFCIWQSLDKKI